MIINGSHFWFIAFELGFIYTQGVEPIWLEKGLFWLETNKMAEKKPSSFHTGRIE
jgi:hypothetical protein